MSDQRDPVLRVPTAVKRFLPPPALAGFLVMLVVMFFGAHAVGSAVGPVAPGMHSTRPGPDDGPAPHEGDDMDDMHSDGGH